MNSILEQSSLNDLLFHEVFGEHSDIIQKCAAEISQDIATRWT